MVPLTEPASPDMSEKWRDGLTVNAARIKARRERKIRDEGDYQKEIAIPSNEELREIFNPALISRSGRTYADVLAAHQLNIAQGYKKWKDALDEMFATVDGEVAKKFVQQVQARQGNIADELARRALRFTGDKVRGRGVAPIASYWLIGYKKAAGMLRPSDIAEGGPYRIVRLEMRMAFKAALQQMLIQAGVLIEVGKYQPAVFSAQNDRINHLIQSLIDPALGLTPFATGGLSHCDYRLDHDQLLLEIQVDRV